MRLTRLEFFKFLYGALAGTGIGVALKHLRKGWSA